MPKIIYICPNCSKNYKKITTIDAKSPLCECGEQTKRQMPNIDKATKTEKKDKILGKNFMEEQSDILRERSLNHFWEVEVPRLVNSGKYSVQHMLEEGWIKYNDKKEIEIVKKEKNL